MSSENPSNTKWEYLALCVQYAWPDGCMVHMHNKLYKMDVNPTYVIINLSLQFNYSISLVLMISTERYLETLNLYLYNSYCV